MPVRYVRILPITKRPAEESAAKDAFSGRDPNAPPRSAHLYLERHFDHWRGNKKAIDAWQLVYEYLRQGTSLVRGALLPAKATC